MYVGRDSVPDATCDWIRRERTVGTLHLAGASRVETSVAIARRHFGSAPVILTTGKGAVEPAVQAYLAGSRTRAYVLGGPAVVSDVTRQSLEAATR